MKPIATVDVRVPFDPSWSFKTSGCRCDESIPRAIRQRDGLYEPEVMTALQRVIRPDAICVDIGANLGVVTLVMASLARDGLMFAFEPVPEKFRVSRAKHRR